MGSIAYYYCYYNLKTNTIDIKCDLDDYYTNETSNVKSIPFTKEMGDLYNIDKNKPYERVYISGKCAKCDQCVTCEFKKRSNYIYPCDCCLLNKEIGNRGKENHWKKRIEEKN